MAELIKVNFQIVFYCLCVQNLFFSLMFIFTLHIEIMPLINTGKDQFNRWRFWVNG